MSGNQFPRAHRLKRRRLIRPLFQRGLADVGFVHVGVVQIRYRTVARNELGADVPFQIGFAPGRTHTKVGRNRLRRLLSETFRLHQHGLANLFRNRPDGLTMMVLFRGKESTASQDIRRDLPEALAKLERRLSDSQ